jgi:predicted nucleic acid-binding protein
MNVVVDASVVLKWFVTEEDSAAALLVRTEHDIAAPDFLLIECRNALLNKVRRRELDRAQADDAESALDAIGLGIEILPSPPILRHAFTIALDLAEPIYDCIYLAAALATDRKLITADEHFAAKVSKSRFGENRIQLLASPRT